MATIQYDVLSEGFVANSVGAIFTATPETAVKLVTFFNTNAAQQTVDLYITKSGGTDRRIARYVLDQFESGDYNQQILLGAGDAIKATTTTASAVDYTVSGGFKV